MYHNIRKSTKTGENFPKAKAKEEGKQRNRVNLKIFIRNTLQYRKKKVPSTQLSNLFEVVTI